MSKYTPTTQQVEDGFAHEPEYEYHNPVGYGAHVRANRRAFKRWLAEVERAAAEKALTEIRGIIAGQGWQPLWFFDKAVEAYRRNEGGRNAESS